MRRSSSFLGHAWDAASPVSKRHRSDLIKALRKSADIEDFDSRLTIVRMAKNQEKYSWMIGSPPPILDQHSSVKHAIVKDYVHQYIKTLMARANIPKLTLTLVDGFCGGGTYLSEDRNETVDGTPLLMLKAVHQARVEINVGRTKTPRQIDAEYFFIDKNPETIKYLNWYLGASSDCPEIARDDLRQAYRRASNFQDEFASIVERIKQRKGGGRSIFLLDQYSYNAVPLPMLRLLLEKLPGAEVILNFNLGSMFTYLGNYEANRKALRSIGLEEYIPWEHLAHIKSQRDWRTVLQRHVAAGIKQATGAPYMTLFFVRPGGANSWNYWLVHLSRHYKAHDVMKQIHWDHSSEFGHELEPGLFILGYDPARDEGYSGQAPLVFGPDAETLCVEQLVDQFGRQLSTAKGPVTIKQLFERNISNTMADEARLQKVVGHLHSLKQVVVSNKDNRLRRPSKHYSLSDVIEHSRQIILT